MTPRAQGELPLIFFSLFVLSRLDSRPRDSSGKNTAEWGTKTPDFWLEDGEGRLQGSGKCHVDCGEEGVWTLIP